MYMGHQNIIKKYLWKVKFAYGSKQGGYNVPLPMAESKVRNLDCSHCPVATADTTGRCTADRNNFYFEVCSKRRIKMQSSGYINDSKTCKHGLCKTTYLWVIRHHAMLTNIDPVIKTKLIGHSFFRTLAQTHFESSWWFFEDKFETVLKLLI